MKFCNSHLTRNVFNLDMPRFSFGLVYAFILIRSSFGIVTRHFSHICIRVMALDLCQNFVSAQYLENKLTDFHQILYIYAFILIRYRLGSLHMIFRTFVLVLWPLIYARFLFPVNIL